MATRGSLGGLARATGDVPSRCSTPAGFDVILVETVGVGQGEVDIARTAHTTIVVEAPGMGDDIQAIKAGLLEIADVLVVNKADRPGADHTVAALEMMLDLSHAVPSPSRGTPRPAAGDHPGPPQTIPCRKTGGPHLSESSNPAAPPQPGGQPVYGSGPGDRAFGEAAPEPGTPPWRPPVIKTIAARGDGILDLVRAIADHRRYLETTGEMARRNQVHLVNELERILRDGLMDRLLSQIDQASLASPWRKLPPASSTPMPPPTNCWPAARSGGPRARLPRKRRTHVRFHFTALACAAHQFF